MFFRLFPQTDRDKAITETQVWKGCLGWTCHQANRCGLWKNITRFASVYASRTSPLSQHWNIPE